MTTRTGGLRLPSENIGRAAVAAVATALLLLMPRLAPETEVFALVGVTAVAWWWMPAALWTASALLNFAYPKASAAAGLAARLVVWVIVALTLSEPRLNWPDVLAQAGSETVDMILTLGRDGLVAMFGLVIVGVVASALLSGPTKQRPDQRNDAHRRVHSGSSVHPAAALIARLAVRALLLLVASTVWISLALSAWTAAGIAGAAAFLRGERGAFRSVDLLLIVGSAASAVLGGAGRGFLMLSDSWGRRQTLGYWVSPAALSRDSDGLLIEEPWKLGPSSDDAEFELAELAEGLLAAYDVALMGGEPRPRAQAQAEAQDPRRQQTSRVYPYRIEVARAWSRPDRHAFVLRATPAAAGSAMARLDAEKLLPTLDSTTRWTRRELERIRLSDARVAIDPLRQGERGLFVGFDRVADVTTDSGGRPAGPEPVQRALMDGDLAGRFHYQGSEDSFEAETHEYAASFTSASEWQALEAHWRDLQPAIALYARNSQVRTETHLESQRFRVVVPKPAPSFPAGEATAWERIVKDHRHLLEGGRPRFIIGLDQQGQPVTMELGHATPSLLIAGATGSGKSRSGLLSPLLQLAVFHDPSELRMWLLDSVKREVTSLLGDLPHVERSVVAEDGAAVVETLAEFTASMDARYREVAGRERTPDDGPAQLLIIEEWADLRDLLDKEQLEAVIRHINRVGQLGRGAGCHIMLVTQKASAEVIPPRLKSNFKGRIAGYFAQASDYGIVFDIHRRLLPNIPGRLAVSDGSTLTVVQGLFVSNDAIAKVVEGLRRRWTGADSAPRVGPKSPRPTISQADIDRLSPLTLARVLTLWQAGSEEEIVVSVRGVIDYVAGLGLRPGRVERYTAGLSRLEHVGFLQRIAEHPTAARRLAGVDLSELERRLAAAVSGPVSGGA